MKYLSILIVLFLAGCVFGHQKITTHEGYVKALKSHVSNRMYLPDNYSESFDCKVKVRQDHEGNVTSIEYGLCEEEESLVNAFGKAIDDSSPFPLPDDMTLFDNELVFRFCPKCEV